MLEAFAATIVGVALAQASPGPNMLAVAGIALGQGRRAATWAVLGVSCAMFIWAAVVAVGLGAVTAAFPSLLVSMKLVGGAYLCWLALRALRASLRGGVAAVSASDGRLSRAAAWRRGFFVVLTNPKAALMWAAVGTFLFGSGLTALQVAAFGPLAAVSAFVIYGSYGWAFSTGVAARAYARFARGVEAALGVAFGALGATLVWDGLRELRGAS